MNASVFYDRIERLHKSAEIDLPILLGHALAHEIGHVLLGTKDHSATGILKPRWSKADFEVPAIRRLSFTPEQSQRMRDEVLRRSAQLPETEMQNQTDVFDQRTEPKVKNNGLAS